MSHIINHITDHMYMHVLHVLTAHHCQRRSKFLAVPQGQHFVDVVQQNTHMTFDLLRRSGDNDDLTVIINGELRITDLVGEKGHIGDHTERLEESGFGIRIGTHVQQEMLDV